MIREPNIIEHLPLFVQEYREIKQIMTAENPEFKLVIDEAEIIKNNQFVVSCDSEGIKRFEKILGVSATEQEPLQSRIARVLIRWNDTVPYTFNAFLEKLDTICGEGNFKVTKKFSEYIIEVKTHLDKYGEVDELEHLLQYIMPSNIQVISKNVWNLEVLGKMGFAAGMVFVDYFELSNDFNETKEIQGDLNFGGTAIDGVECAITDSSEESVNINSDANMGAGVDFVTIITI